jgi:eukaryotic-like serine/threonine-protein kinase
MFGETKGGGDGPRYAIAVADIPSGKHRLILRDARFARYAASGHLLYVTTNKTLMAVPFDQNAMRITGVPVVVTEGMRLGLWGSADLAVSASGTLVYATGTGTGTQEAVWVTRDGHASAVDSDWTAGFLGFPSISPNGKWVAMARSGVAERVNVWVKALDRGPSIKLTFDGALNVDPSWTPDGRSLTYASGGPTTTFGLWTRRADGTTPPVLQFHEKRSVYNPHWSPDGEWLVFQSDPDQANAGDILGIRPGKDSAATSLVATTATETTPALSPDGRWLAYASNETGRYEIYAVPFPKTTSAKWAISSGGGTEPIWSHRGNELFYRDKSGNLAAVTLLTKPTFSVGRSVVLFSAAPFESYTYNAEYAVAPDDKRFLMIRPVSAHTADRLVVVENWFEELRAKSRR